jgi:hypothetical protein
MLEDVPDLTLAFLNEATQAWVERDYNRRVHSETNETPVARFLAGPDVMRPCPDSAALKLAFTKSDRRTQRRSDGTIVVEGNRFEVPSLYRHFTRLEIRYASWDLAHVYLVDEHTGQVLCRLFPQDKVRNASGLRRPLDQNSSLVPQKPVAAPSGIAPLLARLIEQQAESGLPPPYLPKDEQGDDK